VTVKITKTLGQASGLTSFDIGDATLSDRWGSTIGIIEGTVTSQSDFGSADVPIYSSATNILLTANGGNFAAVGGIEVRSHYFLLTHE
jgi:hypothetical protein